MFVYLCVVVLNFTEKIIQISQNEIYIHMYKIKNGTLVIFVYKATFTRSIG